MKRFTLGVAGALVVALLVGSGPSAATATGEHRPREGTPAEQIDRPLRALAKPYGLRIGTAVDLDAFASDETYRTVLARDFSAVTAENAMKWATLEPVRGQYNFGPADQLVDVARRNGQRVHGHTLLWHSQLPDWLTAGVADGSIDAAELREIVRDHISTVVRHFRGRIWHWDVVNEPIADGANPTLRDTIFLTHLGPDYIADALRWAHEADRRAQLWINDYGADRLNAKAEGYYALARQLVEQGAPLHGVGFQGHVAMTSGFPITAVDNLRRFGDLGLATGFTEVDVRYVLPGDNHKTAAQVGAYQTLLRACLFNRSCEMFTVWGFTDRYSWIPGFFPGEGEATPYDANFQPKAAYRALQQELAPIR